MFFFCQEIQKSSEALKEHFMLCGNKTDECPNCHKFIRRAVFAYHYENNCANLNETESTKSNTSTRRSRLNLQQCQFCNYRYALDEYETHKV